MVIDKVAISKSINKIIKSFGGTPTHKTTDLDDCIEDLANNLPFGTKTEIVEIVPEQSITGSYDDDGGSATPMYNADTGVSVDIKANKVYDVYFNDKKYTCTGFDMGDTVALGNVNVMGDTGMADNGEPFCLVTAPSMDGGESTLMCGWDTTEGETITLAIYEEKEIVTPLPAKYMPEPIVFTMSADMSTVTCNKSYEECLKLYQNKVFNVVVDIGVGIYPMTSYMYINDESGEDLCYTLTTSGSQMAIEYSKTGEITIQVVNNG